MIACLKRLRPVDVGSGGKTEEHKASPPTQPRRRRRVWVVRHGEREDEVRQLRACSVAAVRLTVPVRCRALCRFCCPGVSCCLA